MKIGFYGFGSIARLVFKLAIERGHEVVSVVDIDERVLGRDPGELIGLGEIGIRVSNRPVGMEEADVVVHATGSYLDKVYSQLLELIKLGVNIVSTCETLAYPYYRYPVLAKRLDELARIHGVVVLGTGVNPGFILDTLVVTLASSVTSIEKIKAIRSLDAAKRRESFRRKIGIGEDLEVVLEKLRKGIITGHVGYAESVYLIAYAGGLELSRVEEVQEPVVAEESIESSGISVAKGRCKGIHGWASGFIGDREVVRIELYAYIGAPEYEEIVIEGRDYVIEWRSRGTPGDWGTASVVLNTAEKVSYIPPGLRLMTELLPFRIHFSV